MSFCAIDHIGYGWKGILDRVLPPLREAGYKFQVHDGNGHLNIEILTPDTILPWALRRKIEIACIEASRTCSECGSTHPTDVFRRYDQYPAWPLCSACNKKQKCLLCGNTKAQYHTPECDRWSSTRDF